MAFETRDAEMLIPISPALLRWYEEHARALPWRIGPKDKRRPDPYRVWLSEIMLQQTTVATVAPRFEDFLTRWPRVTALAAAPLEDVLGAWAGLGYYARARNLHKCAGVVAEVHSGIFPDTEEALRALPGIGDYTAAAIAAIAFDRPAAVVDGNIERIMARLFRIETPLPAAKKEIKARAGALWPQKRPGDFAQGLMDLGAGVCKPKAPLCDICPLSDYCAAFKAGDALRFPVKPAKQAKPERRGHAFILRNAKGETLFERRPEKGLLGGMLGLPGSPWAERAAADFADAPARATWAARGEITHVFTHFRLTLQVYEAAAPKGFRRARGQQWLRAEDAPLPTVMKKAVGLAAG